MESHNKQHSPQQQTPKLQTQSHQATPTPSRQPQATNKTTIKPKIQNNQNLKHKTYNIKIHKIKAISQQAKPTTKTKIQNQIANKLHPTLKRLKSKQNKTTKPQNKTKNPTNKKPNPTKTSQVNG